MSEQYHKPYEINIWKSYMVQAVVNIESVEVPLFINSSQHWSC